MRTHPGVDESTMRPYWLSHHHADEVDRCLRLGGRWVCRRCTWIGAGFVPALALLAGGFAVQAGDAGLVLALVVVAGIDFVQTARGTTPYSPTRVAVLSPAVGACMAWLAHVGARDGLGLAHALGAVLASSLLVVLWRRRVPTPAS